MKTKEKTIKVYICECHNEEHETNYDAFRCELVHLHKRVYHCPKCGDKGFWRRGGPYFESEMRCPKSSCNNPVWEPNKIVLEEWEKTIFHRNNMEAECKKIGWSQEKTEKYLKEIDEKAGRI